LREAERTLADKEAEVARLRSDLDERSRTADSQRIEMVALKMQIDALKGQVGDHGKRRVQEPVVPEWRSAVMRIAQFAVVEHHQGWHRGASSAQSNRGRGGSLHHITPGGSLAVGSVDRSSAYGSRCSSDVGRAPVDVGWTT